MLAPGLGETIRTILIFLFHLCISTSILSAPFHDLFFSPTRSPKYIHFSHQMDSVKIARAIGVAKPHFYEYQETQKIADSK